MKNRWIEYAEDLLAPITVDEIELHATLHDEQGETNVWVFITDTGEAFWLLEGVFSATVYKKSGIYSDFHNAYEAYYYANTDIMEQDEQGYYSYER